MIIGPDYTRITGRGYVVLSVITFALIFIYDNSIVDMLPIFVFISWVVNRYTYALSFGLFYLSNESVFIRLFYNSLYFPS